MPIEKYPEILDFCIFELFKNFSTERNKELYGRNVAYYGHTSVVNLAIDIVQQIQFTIPKIGLLLEIEPK
jgi:hypothetical protein